MDQSTKNKKGFGVWELKLGLLIFILKTQGWR